MTPLEHFIHTPRIAYFSMEVVLRSEVPTYGGGLGILAGDTLRAAADLDLPMVGITLISRQGYFHQEINDQGQQVEQPDPWQPEQWMKPLDAKVAVLIENRNVWVQAWLYRLSGATRHDVPVIMLDTDLPENAPEDREITDHLYGGDEAYRLKQEVVLGIGGVRMLQALGFEVHTYHLNEGHSALLAIELLWRFERDPEEVGPGESIFDTGRVKEMCLFTTHTPVEAGHDQFDYDLVRQILGDFMDINELKLLAGNDKLNMTKLAMNLSGYINGVAKQHATIANHLYPDHCVHAITNGVHGVTWTCPSLAKLYDTHVPEWRHEPELLVRVDTIPDDEIREAHSQAKQELIQQVHDRTGIELDPQVPILGFARRMTGYKRPHLLFNDTRRLIALAEKHPLQIVLAGKAHPRDESGKQFIVELHKVMRELHGAIKIAYLPNYDMDAALALVSGSDIWLNTPLRPLEASGTSGMKASFNGVINLSVLDGWWLEGCIEGVTGWAIGTSATGATDENEAASLYDKLESTVLPLYYEDPAGWAKVMKGTISKNAYYFNAHRMMRRYATEAYIR